MTDRPGPEPDAGNAALKLLGLARRAGAVAPGVDATRRAVAEGSARLIITADDASPTQLEKVVPAAEREAVPIRILGDRAALGSAVGRSPLSAVAVMDGGFAEQLLLRLPGPESGGDESE